MTYLCRTKASSIRDPYHSNPGVTMRMSCGTRNPITGMLYPRMYSSLASNWPDCSIGSWIPPAKFKGGDGYGDDHTASVYGRETHYEPAPGYQSGRNSPSMAFMQSNQYPPPHSRPPTNYLGVGLPSPRSQDTMDFGGFGSTGAPSDMELDRAVESLLSGADLNSVTKREVRRKLEDRFGIDLTSRKAVINQAIDRVLLRHT